MKIQNSNLPLVNGKALRPDAKPQAAKARPGASLDQIRLAPPKSRTTPPLLRR